MFIKTRNYEKCVQRVRINVGLAAGLENDDEAFIVLKELPTLEMLKLKESTEKGETETLTLLKDLLPHIIVDHNFYEDEDGKKKMTSEALSALIFESVSLTVKVVEEYTHAAFFTQTRKSV